MVVTDMLLYLKLDFVPPHEGCRNVLLVSKEGGGQWKQSRTRDGEVELQVLVMEKHQVSALKHQYDFSRSKFARVCVHLFCQTHS